MNLRSARVRRRDRRWVCVCLACALVVSVAPANSGQQPEAPQTGAPRQLWPQRPGVFRPLAIEASADIPAQAVASAAQSDEPEFVPNEVLVQFEAGVSEPARAAARFAANAELSALLGPDRRLERLTTTLAVPDAIAILQTVPGVEFAEPNWIVHHAASSDDPLYLSGQLWGMYGDATSPANAFGSQAADAWAAGLTGSQDVYVAVIDGGIDVSHPDLAPNVWTNPYDPVNGLDDDGNGRVDDVHGWDFLNEDNSVFDGPGDTHGTHVAGTIGARGGNGIGVAGVSWNVTLISAKFMNANTGLISDAVEALDYIVDLKNRHGLNIVATNNSWGDDEASTPLHQAIIRAAKQGILFIAAAGNGGRDTDVTPHYPSGHSTLVAAGAESAAPYEAIISVAAITDAGARPSFSNVGAVTVDIGAPGSDIDSTAPGNAYGRMSGTSMAAAHVTGAAALYKSGRPAASAAEVRSAILGLAVDTPSMAGVTQTGKRLDVSAFASPPTVSIGDVSVVEGDTGSTAATFVVSLSAPVGSPVDVKYMTVDGTATGGVTMSNVAAIAIPDSGSGSASPYPSTVVVPHGFGAVTEVRVVLHGFTHMWPDDVDVLLLGPAGQTTLLMSDAGGSVDATDVTLTFDDAGMALADIGGVAGGTYRPTNFDGAEAFAGPAPGGPYGPTLSVFSGTSAAGTWSLFVSDDSSGLGGAISRGWSLHLTTTEGGDYVPATGLVTFPAGSTSQPVPVAILGDLTVEPAETFRVVLSEPSGAAIVEGEGSGTIVNDDFTDLSLSGLPIRAIHVIELRANINQARVAKGLGPFPFADALLTPQAATVRALHIVELRTALMEAYAVTPAPPPVFTDPQITPGVTTVKAVHITEIRAALVNLP